MPEAAVVGNNHSCPKLEVLVPHVGGPVAKGSSDVSINGKPAARVGDECTCAVGGPDIIAKGSGTVMINGMPAARKDDPTAHGGKIVEGVPTVIIGG